MMKTGPAYQRILDYGYERYGECLISKAPRTARGYTRIGVGTRGSAVRYRGHRVVFETWYGEVPDQLVVDHNCHNAAAHAGECAGGVTCLHRACINPGHLVARTSAENRKSSPVIRGMPEVNSAKTHCPEGHEYSDANTSIYHGHRRCLTCHRRREALRYRTLKEQ